MAAPASEELRERLRSAVLQADDKGRRLIHRSLTECTDSWQEIANLQEKLSLGHPSCHAALQFLSYLSVSNLDAHLSLFETLRENVELVIMRLDENQLLALLRETGLLLNLKDLKAIPLSIIKRLSKVPPQYLKAMAERNMLQELPLNVRRQAWELDEKAFLDALADSLAKANGSAVTEQAKGVCEMIGASEQLLRAFASHCAAQVVASPQVNYGGYFVKVLVHLQEGTAGGKFKSFDKQHDLASMIERCNRLGRVDAVAVQSLFSLLVSIVAAQAALEERKQQASSTASGAAAVAVVSAKTLAKLIQAAAEADHMSLFRDPVTEAIAPKYFSIVSQPMDLTTMRKKLKEGRYRTVEDVEADLTLMLSNCKKYNGELSPLSRHGEGVWKAYLKAKKKILGEGSKEEQLVVTNVSKPMDLTAPASLPPIARQPPAPKPTPKPLSLVKSAIKIASPTPVPAPAHSSAPVPVLLDPTELLKELANNWKFLTKEDADRIFAEKVTDLIAPGYSKEIKEPMDLSLIKEKIKAGEYNASALEGFERDVKLMFRNCTQFNGKGTPLANEGERIFLAWKGSEAYSRLKDMTDLLKKNAKAVSKTPSKSPAPVSAKGGAVQSKKKDVPRPSNSSSHEREGEENLEERLLQAWEFVNDLDVLELFKDPLTDAIVPGYSKVVKQPMDLRTIKASVLEGEYSSLQAFQEDLLLMWRNCIVFNGEESGIAGYAKELRKIWQSYAKDLQDPTCNTRPSLCERYPSLFSASDRPALAQFEHSLDPESSDLDVSLLLIDLLLQLDREKIFHRVVTEREAPGYSKVVKEKRSLLPMRKKAEQGEYTGGLEGEEGESLDGDVKLMIRNCLNYNGTLASLSKLGLKLGSKWGAVKREVRERRAKRGAKQGAGKRERERTGEEGGLVIRKRKMERDEDEEGEEERGRERGRRVSPQPKKAKGERGEKKGEEREEKREEGAEGEELDEEGRVRERLKRVIERGRHNGGEGGPVLLPPLPSLLSPRESGPPRLSSLLKRCLAYLSQQVDREGLFAQPHSSPHYLAAIDRPVDFSTMEIRLERGRYSTGERCGEDVLLLCANTLLFYGEGSNEGREGERVAFAWGRLRERVGRVLRGEREEEEGGVGEGGLPLVNRERVDKEEEGARGEKEEGNTGEEEGEVKSGEKGEGGEAKEEREVEREEGGEMKEEEGDVGEVKEEGDAIGEEEGERGEQEEKGEDKGEGEGEGEGEGKGKADGEGLEEGENGEAMEVEEKEGEKGDEVQGEEGGGEVWSRETGEERREESRAEVKREEGASLSLEEKEDFFSARDALRLLPSTLSSPSSLQVQELPPLSGEGGVGLALLLLREEALQRSLLSCLSSLLSSLLRDQEKERGGGALSSASSLSLPFENAQLKFLLQLCQLRFLGGGLRLSRGRTKLLRGQLPLLYLRSRERGGEGKGGEEVVRECLEAFPLQGEERDWEVGWRDFLRGVWEHLQEME